MKKLLTTILFLVLIIASCDKSPINPTKNPEKETTQEMLNIVNQDTNCYKVAIIDDELYVIKDNLVIYNPDNDSGTVLTIFLFMFISYGVILLIGILNDR
jgi:PBP1b-binding outer membrane lipoprotein LpoB